MPDLSWPWFMCLKFCDGSLTYPILCRGRPPCNASSCFCHSELVEPVRGPGPFASVFLRAEGVCQLPPCPRRYSSSSRRTSQVWHYRFKAITISCNKGLSGRLLDDVVLGGRVPGALQSVDHLRFPPLRQFESIEDLEVL